MTAPPASLSSKDVKRTHDEFRAPDLGPAMKRERLLQRVRAARKRLPRAPAGRLA
jgi:hypothetical protein